MIDMATNTFYSIMAHDTDANFRIWGKAISDSLQAVGGIAKLSAGDSSGQIDWTSATRPAANTSGGYEMYKFADSLQTSYPVFIKIEYGSGSIGAGTYFASIWMTVGFAHNGSGTLSGFTSTRYQYTVSQNYAVTVYATSHVSAASNRLAFLLRVNPGSGTNQPWSFSVERTHDLAGNDTNYGVMVLIGNGATTWYNYLVTFATGQIFAEGPTGISLLAPSVGHGCAGGKTTLYPVWTAAGPYLCPLTGYLFAFTGNVTSGVPFSVTLLGSSKTYMPRTSSTDSGITARGVALIQCVRWD